MSQLAMNVDRLGDLLVALQHPDGNIRRAGEQSLRDLIALPIFIPLFIGFAADSLRPVHLRHLSILVLNQQISHDWKTFVRPAQEQLIQFAFNGCQFPEAPVRNASTVLLAKIVSRCGASECRDILQYVVGGVFDVDLNKASLSLRCLSVIAEEVDHLVQLEILQLCYTRVTDIFTTVNPATAPGNLFRYASKLMRQCVQKIGNARIAYGFDEASLGAVEQLMTNWSAFAVSWASSCCASGADVINANIDVLLELLRSVAAALEAFPEECEGSFSQTMELSWSILCSVRDLYRYQGIAGAGSDTNNFVSGGRHLNSKFAAAAAAFHATQQPSPTETGYTSDGDRIDLEMLVVQVFELLCIGLTSSDPNAKTLLSGDLNQLVGVLLDYMQLTNEQKEQWEHDANEFVAAEQEDPVEFNLRHIGAEVIREITQGAKERACRSILFASKQETDAFVSVWREARRSVFAGRDNKTAATQIALTHPTLSIAVFRMEAMMWCLGAMGRTYMKYFSNEKRYERRCQKRPNEEIPRKAKETAALALLTAIPVDTVAQLVGTITQTLLLDDSVPLILKGRVSWLFSIFVELFDSETTCVVLLSCLTLLSPPNDTVTRLQACRAMANMLAVSQPDFDNHGKSMSSAEFSQSAITSLLSLSSEVNDSTVHFIIETITETVSCFGEILTLESLERVSELGIQVLRTYGRDPFVLDVVKEMFGSIIKLTNGAGLIAVRSSCFSIFRQWLVDGSAVKVAGGFIVNVNDDNNEDEDNEGCMGDSNSSSNNNGMTAAPSVIPTGIVELVAELLASIAISPGLTALPVESSSAGVAGTGTMVRNTATTTTVSNLFLGSIEMLLSSLRQPYNRARRDCLHRMNVILSHYNAQEIAAMFSSTLEAAEFSDSTAEVVIQCLANCESGEEASECSGAAVGLMCHLFITFSSVISTEATTTMLSTAINVLRSTNNHYTKYSIVMGLVHLFARNAQVLVAPTSPLLTPPPDGSGVNTLGFILDQWCLVHKKLSSKYCITISTLGLIVLVKLLSLSASNQGIALRVLQLILQSLPSLLLPREDDEGGAGGADMDDYKSSDDVDEWDSAGDDYDEDDEDEDDDQDGLEDGNFDTGNGDDPFAPAEMYLSDMIGGSGGSKGAGGKTGGGSDGDGIGAEVYINISDYLVYSPPAKDPLNGADIQTSVIGLLNGLKTGPAEFPVWMSALSAEDQHLIEALLSSV